MRFKFSSAEMYTIINALDFYSRMWIGQYNEILFNLRWYRNLDQLDEIETSLKTRLFNIRHFLMPELDGYGFYGSHGIFNPDVDYRAGIAYDMQQAFRNKLAYFNHPEGGITVDFNPLMHCDNDPYDFAEVNCFSENGKTYVVIEINQEQLEIICNALKIADARNNGKIDELFSYYTDNDNALKLAESITKILDGVGLDERFKNTNKEIQVLGLIEGNLDDVK